MQTVHGGGLVLLSNVDMGGRIRVEGNFEIGKGFTNVGPRPNDEGLGHGVGGRL